MEFENRVVFIPLIPATCFVALSNVFGGNPFGVSSKVNLGDFVLEETPVVSYKQGISNWRDCVSVVAPFPGRIELLAIQDSLDVDWNTRFRYPVRYTTVFAIQPARGSNIEGAIARSYQHVSAHLRALCEPERSLLDSLFKIDRRPLNYAEILDELHLLESTRPRTAPKGVDYDEYFMDSR